LFTAVVSGLQSLLAQPAMLAMASGVLVGAVAGSTLVATGTLPGQPAAKLTVMECPDAGRQVAQVKAGVAMLVTGRNPDGTWVELYLGMPGIERGWVRAANLKVDAAIETLPVIPCVIAPVTALGSPAPTPAPSETAGPTLEPTAIATVVPTVSLLPGQSPTPAPRPTPSPRPTRTPSPTPTPLPPPPTPDLAPPIISNLVITSPSLFNGWYRIYGGVCLPGSATIQVTATDPGGGVASVTLWYKPGALAAVPVSMVPIGGGVWQYVLTVGQNWSDLSEIGLWARAQDTAGNLSSTIYFGNPNDINDISLVKDFCLH
jgi:hypothetical protein